MSDRLNRQREGGGVRGENIEEGGRPPGLGGAWRIITVTTSAFHGARHGAALRGRGANAPHAEGNNTEKTMKRHAVRDIPKAQYTFKSLFV